MHALRQAAAERAFDAVGGARDEYVEQIFLGALYQSSATQSACARDAETHDVPAEVTAALLKCPVYACA